MDMVDNSISISKKRRLIILLVLAAVAVAGFSFCLSTIAPQASASGYFLLPAGYFRLLPGSLQSCVADFFYIRGILALSGIDEDPAEKLSFIQELFARALVLDPSLSESYFFAGLAVGDDESSLRRGIEFISRYRYLNARDWRLLYWIGFNHYLLGEHLEAAGYYRQASLLPGAPSFLKSNQAMLFYQAGKPEMGVRYLEGLQYATRDLRQKKWIKIKLAWLKDIVFLEGKTAEFKRRLGRPPRDLKELGEQGVVGGLPEPSVVQGYYYVREQDRVKSILFQPPAGEKKPCAMCAE